MDLGIEGRWAVVCASTAGLGFAAAEALATEGVNVMLNGRDTARLDAARDKLRTIAPAVEIRTVGADLDEVATTDALLEACAEPDIVITNNAGPRPATLRDATPDDWSKGLSGNLFNHLRLIDRVVDGMQERRFGRIVNITSAMVSAPQSQMTVSSAVRTALTSVSKSLSHDLAPFGVTVNNVQPERIDTGRMRQIAQMVADRRNITIEEARADIASTIAAKRFGRPEELGATVAFLCGTRSGYITGQNIRVDGGTYPGLL